MWHNVSMITIRPMTDSDQSTVKAIAVSTGMFADSEWQGPDLGSLQNDHHWVVATNESGEILGSAYFGPEMVSDLLWNTYFLAVRKEMHGQGVGKFIMQYIEKLGIQSGIRTLIVETSNQESYARARGFYLSLGYVREAEIRNYYGEGDNKIVFWKSISQ
jgi:ribosomal protein S18 acetylase RimI-like enzyme